VFDLKICSFLKANNNGIEGCLYIFPLIKMDLVPIDIFRIRVLWTRVGYFSPGELGEEVETGDDQQVDQQKFR